MVRKKLKKMLMWKMPISNLSAPFEVHSYVDFICLWSCVLQCFYDRILSALFFFCCCRYANCRQQKFYNHCYYSNFTTYILSRSASLSLSIETVYSLHANMLLLSENIFSLQLKSTVYIIISLPLFKHTNFNKPNCPFSRSTGCCCCCCYCGSEKFIYCVDVTVLCVCSVPFRLVHFGFIVYTTREKKTGVPAAKRCVLHIFFNNFMAMAAINLHMSITSTFKRANKI